MGKGNYKRYALTGPGGFKCSCCAPQSGNKHAARALVLVKRQAKRRQDRDIQRDLRAG